MRSITNVDTLDSTIDPKLIRSRHIVYTPPVPDFPWPTVITIGVISFVANAILIIAVIQIVIIRITESGEAKLETGLAKMLLSTYTKSQTKNRDEGPQVTVSGSDVLPVSGDEKPPSDSELLPPETPKLTDVQDTIAAQMDADGDGKIDYTEFCSWATRELSYPLSEKETEMVWKQLDCDKDGQVDKNEWQNFILKRKNLKWLLTRMGSTRDLV